MCMHAGSLPASLRPSSQSEDRETEWRQARQRNAQAAHLAQAGGEPDRLHGCLHFATIHGRGMRPCCCWRCHGDSHEAPLLGGLPRCRRLPPVILWALQQRGAGCVAQQGWPQATRWCCAGAASTQHRLGDHVGRHGGCRRPCSHSGDNMMSQHGDGGLLTLPGGRCPKTTVHASSMGQHTRLLAPSEGRPKQRGLRSPNSSSCGRA